MMTSVQKGVKIHLIGKNIPTNDGFHLKFGISMFFGVKKGMVISEFKNYQILDTFVTSLAPQMT